eukprot:11208575-Lingulodinium_polyedra.AAC.1
MAIASLSSEAAPRKLSPGSFHAARRNQAQHQGQQDGRREKVAGKLGQEAGVVTSVARMANLPCTCCVQPNRIPPPSRVPA